MSCTILLGTILFLKNNQFDIFITLNDALASATAFSMKSSEICLDGCSLKTEFIRAILAALLLASALVGQFCKREKQRLQREV